MQIYQNDELVEIAKELQLHENIFKQLWDMNDFEFTDKIPTVAISFNRKVGNPISLLINPQFWETLPTIRDKCFVICHEMLHILFDHGRRFIANPTIQNKTAANIATDLVINNLLTTSYGFKREELCDFLKNEICYHETVFKDIGKVVKDQNSEYYYHKIVDEPENLQDHLQPGAEGFVGVGSHDIFVDGEPMQGDGESIDSAGFEIMDEDQAKKLNEAIDGFFDMTKDIILNEDFQKEDIKKIQAGITAGNRQKIVSRDKVKTKKKWETVIKRWSRKFASETWQTVERWERKPKQYECLDMNGAIIPMEIEIDDTFVEKNRIEVFFFLDTSGSCSHLAQRFFNAARTLDPKRFLVRLFCFDTKIYETDLKSGKLYGFGGTSFDILEEHIQHEMKKNNIRYPKAVFVITDGYGNSISPELPERWHWFLSEDERSCIPDACNFYALKDFE